MLDLETLSNKVDKALEKETLESLYSYVVEKKDKRVAEIEKVAMELYMSADITIETKFQDRVAGIVNLTYQWKITEPIKLISSAKSITSSPTDGDSKIDVSALEAIENSVVDKMIMDVIREYTPSKQAGLDELTIEKEVFQLCKDKFSDRGVEFDNMSVNVTFSNQVEEALDVMSALKFYESNGEKDLGRDVIKAKAGATTIQVNTSK